MITQRRNSAMRRMALKTKRTSLPKSLNQLLKNGLVLQDGCVLLRDLADSWPRRKFIDKTECEWLTNHLHVDDYLPKRRRDGSKLLSTGLTFEKELVSLLSRNRDVGPFRVIVTVDESLEDPRLAS